MRGTARTKTVPIIFVTAGARDPAARLQGLRVGRAVDFLFKPIEPHILKSKAEVFFELHRQQRELANALRFNEMFMGILGHDLRNPLSAMTSGAQLLGRQLADEGQQRTLRRMLTAAQRMSGMIDQLLDLTRARMAGGVGFVRSRQPVDVAQLVRQAIDELRVAHAEPARSSWPRRGDGRTTPATQFPSACSSSSRTSSRTRSPTARRPARSWSRWRAGTTTSRWPYQQRRCNPCEDVLPTIFDPFRGRGVRASTNARGLGLEPPTSRGRSRPRTAATSPGSPGEGEDHVHVHRDDPAPRGDGHRGRRARSGLPGGEGRLRNGRREGAHPDRGGRLRRARGPLGPAAPRGLPRNGRRRRRRRAPDARDGAPARPHPARPHDARARRRGLPGASGSERPPIASIPVVVVSADPNGAEHAARLQAAGFLEEARREHRRAPRHGRGV